jgi:hypothetical protein
MQGKPIMAKKDKDGKKHDTITDSSDIGDTSTIDAIGSGAAKKDKGDKGDKKHDPHADSSHSDHSHDGDDAGHTGDSGDTGGMKTVIWVDSLALGEDTLTLIDADVQTRESHWKTTTKGKIMVLSAAESPDGDAFADTTADVSVEGADKIKINTHTKSGGDGDSAYEITIIKFKAVDFDKKTGEPTVIEKTTEKVDNADDLAHLDLHGNRAMVMFDNQVNGHDTLADVDAYALAIEDELSQSTVILISAVG